MLSKVAPYAKAIVGFVAPAAVTIGAAVQDSSAGGSAITQAEWVTAAVACIVTSAAVWGTPNKDRQARHQHESVQPPTK